MQRLVCALVLARLDYCNTVLAGLPASTLAPLQRVMNAAVRLVKGLSMRDHITSAMRDLHWLPVTYRIKYKLCLLVHAAVNRRGPEYISDVIVPTNTLPGRDGLRRAKAGALDVPRVRTEFGRRRGTSYR